MLQLPEPAEVQTIDELAVLVAKLTSQRDRGIADSERLETESDAALYAGSDTAVDRLERQAKAARRSARQAEIALPIFQRRLFDAEQTETARKVAVHHAATLEAHDRVFAALAALLDANAAARAVFERAAEDVGYAVAVARIPQGHCQGLTIHAENVERWRLGKDVEFGRRPAQPAPRSDLVTVTFLRSYQCYGQGESASYLPAQAAELARNGVVDIAPEAMPELPFDPRLAEAPEPDSAGRVVVVMVCGLNQAALARPDLAPGGYMPGDVVSLPLAQAIAYVRGGAAEFPVATDVQRGSSADPRVESAGQAEPSP